MIIKTAQSEAFGQEIDKLTGMKTKGPNTRRNHQLKKASPLYKLDPFVDDNGILRVGGRLRRANLSDDHKFPIILPKNNYVSKLIVREIHVSVKHQGRGITLNEIRSNVTGLFKERQRFPSVSQISQYAVSFEERRKYRRWQICTDSFINALRRFVCRRGPARQLRSDQGTNFVGAKAELKGALSELDHEKIGSEMLKNHCDWIVFKMNVPSASHMGGSWERQI